MEGVLKGIEKDEARKGYLVNLERTFCFMLRTS